MVKEAACEVPVQRVQCVLRTVQVHTVHCTVHTVPQVFGVAGSWGWFVQFTTTQFDGQAYQLS